MRLMPCCPSASTRRARSASSSASICRCSSASCPRPSAIACLASASSCLSFSTSRSSAASRASRRCRSSRISDIFSFLRSRATVDCQSTRQKVTAATSLGLARRLAAAFSSRSCRVFSSHIEYHADQPRESFWFIMRLMPCEPSCSTRRARSFSTSSSICRFSSASRAVPFIAASRASARSALTFLSSATALSRSVCSALSFCSVLIAFLARSISSQSLRQCVSAATSFGLERRPAERFRSDCWRWCSFH